MNRKANDRSKSVVDADGRVTRPAAIHVISKAARRIARAWSLTPDEAARLLDVPDVVWARIAAGSYAEPFEAGQGKRAGLLVALYEDGHRAFEGPLATTWVMRPNTGPDFGGRRPVDLMLDDGIEGMRIVLAHLQYIWYGK
ncbi:antitoxin Xre/MbcA/ParS toxin-binding domain-containing protein [uncultured Jannaschia sp.]|uniref:antitoxin Xre/MbcA/ParS toxin-binding domain-containing protein n=1 Tax=uncultured Jannaschia sp. TaxID=293347 RepID=UPI00262898A6|nr:antitoxin Xre/MbcA/ParS toxin-binding domain-containing protein [uncultured Jannaschia sp.]